MPGLSSSPFLRLAPRWGDPSLWVKVLLRSLKLLKAFSGENLVKPSGFCFNATTFYNSIAANKVPGWVGVNDVDAVFQHNVTVIIAAYQCYGVDLNSAPDFIRHKLEKPDKVSSSCSSFRYLGDAY